LRGDVEAQIARSALSDRYYLLGFVDDVEDFYSVFDVFVSSSRQEGLGSSVLDAFLYGVPVVSTDAGGLRELVDGRGLLCAVGDSVMLAELIKKALDDSQWRARAVETSRAYAKSEFSLERVTQQYLKIYSSIVK
jgi:glycosyltransferase involved in cell wall biosynthesis